MTIFAVPKPVVEVKEPVSYAPVVGQLRPFMDDDFKMFATDTMNGLVCVRPPRIDFLAITAEVEGMGDCGRFLAACMDAYDIIGVWEIHNPKLASMLSRRGFRVEMDTFSGELIKGMMWRKDASRA